MQTQTVKRFARNLFKKVKVVTNDLLEHQNNKILEDCFDYLKISRVAEQQAYRSDVITVLKYQLAQKRRAFKDNLKKAVEGKSSVFI